MSDANRLQLGYVLESTFGETPSGPPTLKLLRFTRESLGMDTDTVVSEEIRADRQDADVLRVGISAAGELGFELSQDSYDEFFEAALLSAAWTAEVDVISTDVNTSVASSDNSFNHTTAWTNTPTAGTWVYVTGFTDATANGFFKVAASPAPTSTKFVVTGGTLPDESAGNSITIRGGAQILNGTTFRSFAIEKEYQDQANEFAVLNGMVIDGLSISIPVDGIVTGAFSFLGTKETSATATAGDGSPTAAAGTDVMNSIDHISKIVENGAEFASVALSFDLSNNHRVLQEIGTLGATDMGTGTVSISGTLQAYFKTKAVFDRYLNFTTTDLSFATLIGGEGYVFDFPKVKFTGGRRVAGGKNTDIIADLEWTAVREPTENVTVRIARWT
jgi:hypothetical protein